MGHYNKTSQINLKMMFSHFFPSRRQKALALSYNRAYKRCSAILRGDFNLTGLCDVAGKANQGASGFVG